MKNLKLLFIAYIVLFFGFSSCKKADDPNGNNKRLSDADGVNQTFLGTVYYVSSSTGNDNNTGLTEAQAWKTLAKVSGTTFSPGDAILFKAGDVWTKQSANDINFLQPKGSGTNGSPITIDKYGPGDLPLFNFPEIIRPINTNTTLGIVMLVDQSYWNINNLKIVTNSTTGHSTWTQECYLAGIAVKTTGTVVASDIAIDACQVNSSDYNGIVFSRAAIGIGFVGRFSNNIAVQNSKVENTISGIQLNGDPVAHNPTFVYTTNAVFKNNFLKKIGANGVVMNSVNNGLIERNRLIECSTFFGAGIWLSKSNNSVIQFNEVSDQHNGSPDGTAFDDDINCNGNIFQYNYTHNNAHGAMMFMSSSTNAVYRFNVSVNDGGSTVADQVGDKYNRLIGLDPSSNHNKNLVHNNVFYIGSGISTKIFGDYSQRSGSNSRPKLYNNIFYVDGGQLLSFGQSPNVTGTTEFKNNCFYPANTLTGTSDYNLYTSFLVGNITGNPLLAGATATAGGLGTQLLSTSGDAVNFSNAALAFKLNAGSPCFNAGYPYYMGPIDFANQNISALAPTIGAVWNGASAPHYYLIKNRNLHTYLHLKNNTGKVEAAIINTAFPEVQWIKEEHEGYTRFRNRATNQYILDNGSVAYLEYGTIWPAWWACDFSLVVNGSFLRLQNRNTGKFVNLDNNLGYAQSTASLPVSAWSGDWEILSFP